MQRLIWLLSLSLIYTLVVITVGCEHPVVSELSATSIPEHPRLFFNADDIPTLQAKTTTSHQEVWTPIKAFVDSQLGVTPSAAAPPDGELNTYRNAGNQLIPFAFACSISRSAQYCDLAKSYLLTYASWDQWGEENVRDLGHAHMLMGNAIAYDWLYSILTPEERLRVRQSLADWAQKMYDASAGDYQDPWSNWWRKAYMQNHHWTNNSALGMAGLALLGEDDRAQIWIDQASSQMSRVQYLLNGIEDGSWHEGIFYQNYGLIMSLPFMVNLRQIQGTDILPHDYLQNYPYWRLYNHLSNGQYIMAYGDFEWWWGHVAQSKNILRFVAHEYNNGHAEWLAQQLATIEDRSVNVWSTPWYVFEFLYYNPSIAPKPPLDLPKARVFPDLAGVIWRTGWDDRELVFALKTGAYGGRFAFNTFVREEYPWDPPCSDTECQLSIGHDHDDANGFYLYRAGHWLAPEHEGSNIDSNETRFHNTFLIDGEGQYRPPEDHYGQYPEDFIGSDGFLEATASTQNFDYVATDATRRYKNIPGMEDVTRHVLFVRPDYFVMVDNLVANAEHRYEWVSHFGESVAVEGNWVRGDAGGEQILGVATADNQSFAVATGNDGRPYVRIQPASPVDDVRFINILYPTDVTSWDRKPTIDILDDTGTAAAVRVTMQDGSDRVDDVLLNYTQPISTTTVGPYEYNGQVAVVTRGADGDLERIFVYGGTSFTDRAADKVLIANLNAKEPFEAVFSDKKVVVSGSISTTVTLYAPQTEQLTVNGLPNSFIQSGDYISFEENPKSYLPLMASK